MNIANKMIIIFIGSFLIKYFLMPPITVNNIIYITNNLGKVYSAVIMSIFMLFLEVIKHDFQYKVLSLNLYAMLTAGLAIFIYFYRYQIAINDKQYIKWLIEHNSMSLLTSEEILKKTNNYDVIKLAKNEIQKQTDELRIMKELLKK
jgi:hypothetical protein